MLALLFGATVRKRIVLSGANSRIRSISLSRSLKAPASKMDNHERRPFVSLLICDFDGTITTNESAALLAAASLASSKRRTVSSIPDPVPLWSFFVDAYLKDCAEHQLQWQSSFEKGTTLDDYFGFLESLRTVEYASIDRVGSHAVLAGLTRDELVECGRTLPKRAGFEDVFNDFLSSGPEVQKMPRDLHILSFNWSKDLIRGAMLGVRGFDEHNIHSNNLVFNSDGLATGQIETHVVTAMNKAEFLRRLINDNRNALHLEDVDHNKQGALCVYIGDSSADIPSMSMYH